MEKITVEDQKHLIRLIKEAIGKNGNGCDLKHIDLSQITDLSWIFLIIEKLMVTYQRGMYRVY